MEAVCDVEIRHISRYVCKCLPLVGRGATTPQEELRIQCNSKRHTLSSRVSPVLCRFLSVGNVEQAANQSSSTTCRINKLQMIKTKSTTLRFGLITAAWILRFLRRRRDNVEGGEETKYRYLLLYLSFSQVSSISNDQPPRFFFLQTRGQRSSGRL